MPDVHEGESLVAAAEQAAAAGDYASAERLLRDALERQETDLGPGHPDLANTLNNLGVVCDMADKVDDAEQCYRRAYAIAAAALTPDHPFVATSRRNFEDFCAARGRPVNLPEPASPNPVPGSAARPIGPMTVGVSVCALAAVMLVVVAGRSWLESERPKPESPARTRVESRPAAAEPTVRHSAPPARRFAAVSTTAPTVVNALLCRALSTGARDWRCDPAGSTVGAGPVFFYSRLRTPRATTVLHRWYRGDRLQQEATLSIGANPSVGYRTYSRRTMTADSIGDWRVELVTGDGQVLHEERFTVR